LLVEDEDQVRQVVRTILVDRGYQVLEAGRGPHALELSRRTPTPIDLLLTDVAMPEMNGRVLAEQLRLERPDIEVIFMSGYPDKAIGNQGVLDAPIAFLQKPVTPLTLITLVRQVLDARKRQRGG
jgi:CheY-like chemotaxis protein